MKKKHIVLAGLSLMLAACGQQNQTKSDTDFPDQVKAALSNGGKIDINGLQWTREPGGYKVKGKACKV